MIQGPAGISPDVLQSYSNSTCNKSIQQLQEPLTNNRTPGHPGAQLEPGLLLAVTLRYLA